MRGQHREVALQSRCPKTLAAPQSTGAAELGKHPVEIGHDEIVVRFAPMSRTEGVLIADAAGRARTRRVVRDEITSLEQQGSVTEDGFAFAEIDDDRTVAVGFVADTDEICRVRRRARSAVLRSLRIGAHRVCIDRLQRRVSGRVGLSLVGKRLTTATSPATT
jgi:hypothetical protein